MPYDAQGNWQTEDDSTSAAVAKVASTASPIMKQATGDAMRIANRRGLYNSTIAAGAGVDAALRSATTIGAADANATLQKNLSKQSFVQGTGLQGQQIQGQKDITGQQIAGQKDVTGMQIAGQKDVAGMNIASAEKMQQAELVSKAELQRAEIASREDMLGRQLTSEETRQAEQIGANKYMQQQQLTSAELQQQKQITSTETIQAADQALRREMNALQTSTQQAIAQMNIASKERDDAIKSATQMQALYTQMFDAILSNPDLPADQRALYLEHAKNLSGANLNLVKGVYSANITWPAAA